MSWSNIFLQLITATGPVIGEGLLEGWQGSIELKDFNWSMKVLRDPADSMGGIGGLGGALTSLVGLGGNEKNVQMSSLTFKKRFDIASSTIHTCLDMEVPVLSASITVLNIKQGGRAIHMPGFTLIATDGFFSRADLSLEGTGTSAELVETVTLNFKMIVLTYLRRMGKDNIPTNPFIFKRS